MWRQPASASRIASLVSHAFCSRPRALPKDQSIFDTCIVPADPGAATAILKLPRCMAIRIGCCGTKRRSRRSRRAFTGLITECDTIAAHNAKFDLSFIDAELAAAGLPPIDKKQFCTMEQYSAFYHGKRSLDTVAARIGLSRAGPRHGALEDAWLAMMVLSLAAQLSAPRSRFLRLKTRSQAI